VALSRPCGRLNSKEYLEDRNFGTGLCLAGRCNHNVSTRGNALIETRLVPTYISHHYFPRASDQNVPKQQILFFSHTLQKSTTGDKSESYAVKEGIIDRFKARYQRQDTKSKRQQSIQNDLTRIFITRHMVVGGGIDINTGQRLRYGG